MKKILIYCILISSFSLFSYSAVTEEPLDEKTLIRLKFMRDNGQISEADYLVLTSQAPDEGEIFYELKVNGFLRDEIFKVLEKDGKTYFPLLQFFQSIEFNDYEESKNSVEMRLGVKRTYLKIDLTKEDSFRDEDDIYLEYNSFKSNFLNYIIQDKDRLKVNVGLNFETPEDIRRDIDRTAERLRKKKGKNTLRYTNSRELFELGYMRVQYEEVYSKNSSESSLKRDWNSNLEYQGNLLYGEFFSKYDVKKNEIREGNLSYDELKNDHIFEILNNRNGNNQWENSLSFKKNRGYYVTGRNYTISEIVPVGSRVELLYYGIPIQVVDEEGGRVVFDSPEIIGDRKYVLRIILPNGIVEEREIDTAPDYSQQNRGEFEYDFFGKTDRINNFYQTDLNFYYGATENLTLGGGYRRDKEREKIVNSVRGEALYTNFFLSNPYTVILGADKNSYDFLGDIRVKKLRIIAEKDRLEESYRGIYTPFSFLELDSGYIKGKEKDYYGTLRVFKNGREYLFTGEYTKSSKDRDLYSMNLYYTGFQYFNSKFGMEFKDKFKEYTGTISLYGKSFKNRVDISLEASYSQQEKEYVTLRIAVDLMNLLSGEIFRSNKKEQGYRVGLNRVVDLKSPLTNIETMSSSRAKVHVFLDENNNNIYDRGEKFLEDTEITIGSQTKYTDESGVAYFYGVPQNIDYQIDPKVTVPSFTVGKNDIVVRGKNTGTVDVYIPIKPLFSLEGKIEVDFRYREFEKAILENLIVKIRDESGIIYDTSALDGMGEFDLNSIPPGDYLLVVKNGYSDLEIPEYLEHISLNFKTDQEIYMHFKIGDIIERIEDDEEEER